MPTYRVSLNFTKLSDAELIDFTSAVILAINNNDAFPTPAVPINTLSTKLELFQRVVADAALGGPQATAAKNEVREALVVLLRTEAFYVQNAMQNNLSTLLSSGFEAASTNKTQEPLPAPTVLKIDNEQSTQLVVQLKKIDNARAYEVQKMNGTGGWITAGIFTRSRRIVVENLVPGSTYSLQARAIGGSTGYSPWSDPVSHMAT